MQILIIISGSLVASWSWRDLLFSFVRRFQPAHLLPCAGNGDGQAFYVGDNDHHLLRGFYAGVSFFLCISLLMFKTLYHSMIQVLLLMLVNLILYLLTVYYLVRHPSNNMIVASMVDKRIVQIFLLVIDWHFFRHTAQTVMVRKSRR